MPLWLQHLLVIMIVAGCVGVVALQAVRALRGRKAKLGSCCAKGCDVDGSAKPQAADTPAERVVFMPVEMLKKR
jgi:hypothetical protein